MYSPEEFNRLKSHKFDSWSNQLMDLPPTLDLWQDEQVGLNNQGPFRAGYQNILIKDNKERLVPLNEFGLVNSDYYTKEALALLKSNDLSYLEILKNGNLGLDIFVRESIAKRLQSADLLLRKHDLFLRINSGWRHPQVQKMAKIIHSRKESKEMADALFASVSLNYHKSPPPHSTGGAIDLELWSLQNQSLLSIHDGTTNFYTFEKRNNLSSTEQKIRNVRRILFHLLTTPGVCLNQDEIFTIHPGEFWHFGDGDPLSTYLTKKPFAKYGFIEPNI